MPERVYVETSIVSYLTARPSRDVRVARQQQITREWWETRADRYELCTSELVLSEAGQGDPEYASRRLLVLQDLPVLETPFEAVSLAEALTARGALSGKSRADALHIAVATVNGIEYLLTWNCKHIANARMRPRVERLCRARGYAPPVLCTPEDLMGG